MSFGRDEGGRNGEGPESNPKVSFHEAPGLGSKKQILTRLFFITFGSHTATRYEIALSVNPIRPTP